MSKSEFEEIYTKRKPLRENIEPLLTYFSIENLEHADDLFDNLKRFVNEADPLTLIKFLSGDRRVLLILII